MESRLSASDMAFDGYGSDDETATAPVHFLPSAAPDPADLVADANSDKDMHLRLSAGWLGWTNAVVTFCSSDGSVMINPRCMNWPPSMGFPRSGFASLRKMR